ncbi:preATP grasp domain-containing protein [Streptomyces alboflavus]|uniref:preATP grasp domain-containing protein n=1 Tax=Streptomyces alboflavus TaxID=67267 RepID=UPI0036C70A39
MVNPTVAAPQLVLANFASALAVDLSEHVVLQKWATQAPREVWLLHPGDLLATPVRPSEAFLAAACGLLGMTPDDITVVTVPDQPGMAMADSVRRVGLLPVLARWARARPGARMLPVALDAPTTRLARDLGIEVAPYPDGAPPPAHTVAAVMELNTKSGFRTLARQLDIRVPPGETCAAADLPGVVRSFLAEHGGVAVKPDRAAGGHGLRFLPRPGADVAETEAEVTAAARAASHWVVERLVPHRASLSAQFSVEGAAARWEFDGTMTVLDGAFTGYRSPLPASVTAKELREWGTRFGHHLAALGYRGPFGLDALLAEDGGMLYATEANVRRTATTTPYVLVRRLAGAAKPGAVSWNTGHIPGAPDASFEQAHTRLAKARLDYRPDAGEGVVLYADVFPDVPVRYLVIAATTARAAELERLARRALDGRSFGP